MDFIGGALPNVMFLVGIIAVGIGLGLEFKIIEVKNGLSRGGRAGAILIGAVLMATSVALYLWPTTAPRAATSAPTIAPTTAAPSAATSAPTMAPAALDAAPSATTAPPMATPTATPLATVPDLLGLTPKEAQALLEQAGLQVGERRESCAELGGDDSQAANLRKGRIACQSVAAGANLPLQTAIDYALVPEKSKGGNE